MGARTPFAILCVLLVLCASCSAPSPSSIRVPALQPLVIPFEPIGSITTRTAVNRYARLREDAPAGSTVLQLDSDLEVRPHDLILLYEAQGAQMENQNTFSYGIVNSYKGAGSLELLGVASVDAGANNVTVYDWCGGLSRARSKATTQVLRVPQYQFLDVASTGIIEAPPWDGKIGGVVALSVSQALILDGTLTATGRGFRGGSNEVVNMPMARLGSDLYRSRNKLEGGMKGEGIAGDQASYAAIGGAYGRGAPGNGGGGGNALMAGGGGGGNGGEASTRSGNGVMIESAQNVRAAWRLDPAYITNRNQLTTESGGGRGGYSYSEAAEDPQVRDPGDVRWRGDSRRVQGGLGGSYLVNEPKEALFMGGGGGAGDNSRSSGSAGGAGGGLVLLFAGGVQGSGTIEADGLSGVDIASDVGGGGGGGAGGSILVSAPEINVRNLSARGGAGGRLTGTSAATGGPGGGGGGGYIATLGEREAVSIAVSGGSAGTTASSVMTLFTQNGATAGHDGIETSLDPAPYGGVTACTTSDLAVGLAVEPALTTSREPVEWTVTVLDRGQTAADRIELYLQLPETSVIVSIEAPDWTCTQSEPLVLCTRRELPLEIEGTIIVKALPPLAVTSALATATLRSRSLDPDISNNITQAEIRIDQPLAGHAFGGGLACSASGPRGGSKGTLPGVFVLLLCTALLVRRRLLRSSGRGARKGRTLAWLTGVLSLVCADSARAQSPGFQLNRFEPAPSGLPFLAVESPQYNSARWIAAGLTLHYAHNLLRYGEGADGLNGLSSERGIISHQIVGDLDFSVPFRNRILLHAAVPVILLERGQAQSGITPISAVAVSDPRLSVWVRAYRFAHLDRLSVHIGASLWLPLRGMSGSLPAHTSDLLPRVRLAVALSGTNRAFRYSGTFGLLYRNPESLAQTLSTDSGQSGPEAQIGLAGLYSVPRLALSVGPEVLFATSLLPSRAMRRASSSLEIYATAQHRLARQFLLGLGIGMGLLSAPGTPDARLVLRLAWAPVSDDRDQDGVPNESDACPDQKGVRSDVPSNHGCPLIPDRDCDGIPDLEDQCPDSPEGPTPDPQRIGCPRGRTRT